jgi:anti-sigma factor RsiW
MTTQPLTCREFVEIVTDYLEGALAPADVERFEQHLGVCPGCDTYLDQIRQTVGLTGRLREQDLAPPARDALLAAFRDWKQSAP